MKTTKQELKIKVSEMALFEQRWPFLNPSRVYYAYFEAVPNYIICKRIEYIKAKNWVEGSLSDQILKVHSRRELNDSSCEIEITDIIYILNNPVRKGITTNWEEYPFSGSLDFNLNEIINYAG